MSRRLFARALAALALACLPAVAHASVRPGVDVKITGVNGPVRPGVPVTAQVLITAQQPLTLRQFEFSMRGTTVTSDAPPDSVVLAAGQSQLVNISVVPGTDENFEVAFVADGVRLVRKRNWSQSAFDLLNYGSHVGFDPQPEPPSALPPVAFQSVRLPEARPLAVPERSMLGDPVLTLEGAMRQARALGATAVETHHLTGAVKFRRPDNSLDRVDGATFTLWLDGDAFDLPLGSGVLDHVGRYDVTATIPTTFGRKFYIVFTTENSWVHVLNNLNGDDPFKFVTSRWNGNVGGGDRVQSFIVPTDDAHTCHMLTTVTRGFRYVLDHSTYEYPGDIDDVDVAFPESDWPHYTWPFSETIFIPDTDWAWNAGTLLHEFGHHVNYELPIDMLQQDYDDGNCETAGNDGRHCAWCAEDDLNVAVAEGFANFCSQTMATEITDVYGAEVLTDKAFETLPTMCNLGDSPCNGCPPLETEGYFAAVLLDLADDTPGESDDNSTATLPGIYPEAADPEDRLDLGFNAILHVMADYGISTVQDFRDAFMDRYSGSLSKSDIWKTWANAGYYLDNTPPLPPSGVTSPSHVANTASPDATIDLTWTAGADLHSAVQKYGIRFYKNNVYQSTQYANGTSFSTAELSPGTYRFELFARDLQGNNSNPTYPYAVSPNYVVRDPYPMDLNERLIAGWTDGVVVRSIAGATSSNCTDTPTLAGNQDSTWFNWAVENTGEELLDTTFRTRLLVDGVPLDSSSTISIIGPPNSQTVLNRGPHTIRGGRHTVEVWTDASERIAEAFENNNRWGRQFVWKPLSLSRNAAYTRPAPPDRLGGSNVISVPIGSPRFYNCDGLSYTHANTFPPLTSTRWVASELWAEHPGGRSSGANYDLMLHFPSDGSNDGFTDGLTTASRGANLTDAIITNNANISQNQWNLGVVNTSGDSTDYHVRINSGGTMGVGDSVVVNIETNQMVLIRALDVQSGETGKLTAEIRRLTGTGTFKVSWINSVATYRTLSSVDGTGTMNSSGFGSVSFTASNVSSYALLVWRDPSAGTAPASISLKVYAKPADLAIVTPAGWVAPLVPRPTNDATGSLALAPGVLYGDDKPTYLSASKRNASDVTSGFNVTEMRLDDQTVYAASFTGLAGLTTYTHPNLSSPLLPGGRHVLSLLLDPSGLLPELDELNNTHGAQWSWLPDTAASDAARWRRGQVGGPMAGWEYCSPAEYLYFDCDGVRLPVWAAGSGVDFAAVAVSARDSADVDLALHEPTNSSDAGFETSLEESFWPRGETELLLVNYSLAARKAYDVGITRASDDTSSYLVDVVPGVTRNPAQAVHGPFTLAAHRLVHVHQFVLPAGRHVFHLRNLSGTVDWALSAYDAERPFQNRSQGEERGWSYANGAGADEELTIVVTQPTAMAIVVHKTGSAETAKSGTYQLELNTDVTGTADGPVLATRLASAFPNPFRGSSQLHFDVARAGEVTLEVYDLRGARVRTLARGHLAAGRHSLAWDGRDELGARAPAGVYLVRMSAPGYSGQRKLVRVE